MYKFFENWKKGPFYTKKELKEMFGDVNIIGLTKWDNINNRMMVSPVVYSDNDCNDYNKLKQKRAELINDIMEAGGIYFIYPSERRGDL